MVIRRREPEVAFARLSNIIFAGAGTYAARVCGGLGIKMPDRAPNPASQRYRARAEECRIQAESFRDPKARTQMLQLAADYERKAVRAEAFEIEEPKTNQSV